jgi:hypothetical protein
VFFAPSNLNWILLYIVRVSKLRRKRLARHVAWMGEKRNVYGRLVGKPVGKSRLEDLSVDGRTVKK